MAIRELANIRKRRQSARITATDLAAAAGISRVYLAQLEAGTKTNPSLLLVRRLQLALAKLEEERRTTTRV